MGFAEIPLDVLHVCMTVTVIPSTMLSPGEGHVSHPKPHSWGAGGTLPSSRLPPQRPALGCQAHNGLLLTHDGLRSIMNQLCGLEGIHGPRTHGRENMGEAGVLPATQKQGGRMAVDTSTTCLPHA